MQRHDSFRKFDRIKVIVVSIEGRHYFTKCVFRLVPAQARNTENKLHRSISWLFSWVCNETVIENRRIPIACIMSCALRLHWEFYEEVFLAIENVGALSCSVQLWIRFISLLASLFLLLLLFRLWDSRTRKKTETRGKKNRKKTSPSAPCWAAAFDL